MILRDRDDKFVATEIEKELKSKNLVGKRLGSGLCLANNSGFKEFEWKHLPIRDFPLIKEIIKSIISKYDYLNLTYSIKPSYDSFVYFIKQRKSKEK